MGSEMCIRDSSKLQTKGPGRVKSGAAIIDAPLNNGGWLVEQLQGQFVLAGFGEMEPPQIDGIKTVNISSDNSIACDRYGADVTYLIRPDGHIAASFEAARQEPILAAWHVALGKGAHHV